ncbi:hypothetical protein [Bradyrhizobium sp. CCBAU 53421]|uniref:DUF6894 family protein n=1 Tax=Bradyrhizobium sp. CCBAU 53421 TaxID=1325120 RepID=UPI00188C0F88|nr:hypothetical protein [Bradyrhizobium sp. CCBAU 53421]QOZ37874.1 hypothetical protein XH92_14925 [Bradyrhizobium sp. CCBAU 53421]
MPRYYFDLKDDNGVILDEEGLHLRDLEEAQNEAARSLGGMARDALANARGAADHMEIAVRDDDGDVMVVRFSFEISRKRQN